MNFILLIEDEAPIREMLRFALELANFKVLETTTGEAGLAELKQSNIDLVLLDWMLPDQSGLNVLKTLRSDTSLQNIPVIMLTALAEEENKIRGLQTGADDYIVKPFSPMELIARIQALLRRSAPRSAVLECGFITIDLTEHIVHLAKQAVKLTQTEYELLLYLVRHKDRVVSRQQLLAAIWEKDNKWVNDRTVDAHIKKLRKLFREAKLADPIETRHGQGYCFNSSKLEVTTDAE